MVVKVAYKRLARTMNKSRAPFFNGAEGLEVLSRLRGAILLSAPKLLARRVSGPWSSCSSNARAPTMYEVRSCS